MWCLKKIHFHRKFENYLCFTNTGKVVQNYTQMKETKGKPSIFMDHL